MASTINLGDNPPDEDWLVPDAAIGQEVRMLVEEEITHVAADTGVRTDMIRYGGCIESGGGSAAVFCSVLMPGQDVPGFRMGDTLRVIFTDDETMSVLEVIGA